MNSPADAARGAPEADEVICFLTLQQFTALSPHYADFRPTPDEQVIELREALARRAAEPTGRAAELR